MSATKYVLLAGVFYLRQEDGTRKRYRTGDVVEGLNPEQVDRLLRVKAIARASDVEKAAEDASAPGDTPAADDGKPGADANKPELVEWIYENVSKADGSDYTKTELRKMDPEDLRAIVDSVE